MSEYDANKYLAESVADKRVKRDQKPIKTFPLGRFALIVLGVVVLCVLWPLLL